MPAVADERIAGLINELDSEQFKVRSRASKELERLGELAEPALSKALAGKTSLESRQRLDKLVDTLLARPLSPEQLHFLRALEVLEQIATPDARQVLATLAKDAPAARLTKEAKASLERLVKRVASVP